MNTDKVKQLFKIVIAVAWIDGKIQPEEKNYLQLLATEKGLQEDPEIKILLSELKPVEPEECYNSITDYLGEHPQKEDYEQLIDDLSALIYSDGEVAVAEAQLLTKLQSLAQKSIPSDKNNIVSKIQQLYRRWVGGQ
jgi:uncharacterized tellurite resistance protein B-like protein